MENITATVTAPALRRRLLFSTVLPTLIAAGLIAGSWQLSVSNGDPLALSLLLGATFGVLLQRARFCFFCVTRDFLDHRDARGLLGILAALAVGTLGYHLIFGLFVPDPAGGRLPPDAHIGPVSWVLALAAFTFGSGMTLSGSCISAHLYRLGEGAIGSVAALGGVLIGFGLGFATWNTLYLAAIDQAPVIWLPDLAGYGGSILIQLGGLSLLGLALMRWHRPAGPAKAAAPASFRGRLMGQRWPTYVGGLLIGALAVMAYLRVAPLGVTAELGSLARTAGSGLGVLPDRLQGLDGFSGCATAVKNVLLSENGAFIIGLILASLASALAAGDFRPQRVTVGKAAGSLAGGVLMGWGAMTALGCTVGTLLSGIMAAAVSGWVFALFCLLGLWVTWRIRN
ncbi:YeeE/YedE family protein [Spiribacter roseus]|uniref:YeeE/YedE family protein n=1 Tax=Spiribacter roseus TaxID=1855875 RepID=UPI00190F2230|nr:YeeE/YedE family protein [Spiribacter roseus]